MQAILPAVLGGDQESLDSVAEMDDGVDALHGQIANYVGEISRRGLTGPKTEEIEMDVLQNLKRIYYFAKRMARAAVPTVLLREAG